MTHLHVTASLQVEATNNRDASMLGYQMAWRFRQRHNGHYHPIVGPVAGLTFAYTVPSSGHSFDEDVDYEVSVVASDNRLTSTATATLTPERVQMRFTSSPAGQIVRVDSMPRVTPFTVSAAAGRPPSSGSIQRGSNNSCRRTNP